MIKTKNTWTIANIMKMFDERKTLSLDHPIQRQSEQWDNQQKSLLIHSMLANYPIPNIYVLKEDSEQVDEKGKPIYQFYVIDGKQRLSNVISFMKGDYALEEDIPNVMIEEEEYAIGGKYFQDLDEVVQYELKRFKFDIYNFEDCTNEEVEEIFKRLNNSTPLTKAQLAKSSIGTNIAIVVNKLLQKRFFVESCNFSNSQRKNSDDQKSLFLGMMLLDYHNDCYELEDFCEKSIMQYASSIKNNYSDLQINNLYSCIEFLTDAFPSKQKTLRKISIPMLMYLGMISIDYGIKPYLMREWWKMFYENEELVNQYKIYCSSGSTKLEKVKGRVCVLAKSFCEYCKIDIPDKLYPWMKELEMWDDSMQEKKEEMEQEENLMQELDEGEEETYD